MEVTFAFRVTLSGIELKLVSLALTGRLRGASRAEAHNLNVKLLAARHKALQDAIVADKATLQRENGGK
jgi:hypothetical protein